MRPKVPLWRVLLDLPVFWISAAAWVPVIPLIAGGALERVMGERNYASWRALKIGIASLPMLVAPRFLPLVGFASTWPLDERLPYVAKFAVGIAVWLAASLVMYPVYAAPFEMIDRRVGIIEGIVSAAATNARKPLLHSLTRAFGTALVGAFPLASYFDVASMRNHPAIGVLSVLTFLFLTPVCVVAVVAHAWSDGRERFGSARPMGADRARESAVEGPLLRRLAGGLLLALTPVLVVVFATFVVALVPTSARTVVRQTRIALPSDLSPDQYGALRYPTNSGLRTERPRADTLFITTADGGGAGEVRLPCVAQLAPGGFPDETAFREMYRGIHVWTYRVAEPTCESRVSFTDQGVRVDDSTLDRIAQRWGGWGVWLLLGVLLLSCFIGFDQLRWLGRARGLDTSTKVLLGTVALEGRIALGAARVQGSLLTTAEGLRIDLGEHGMLTLHPHQVLKLLHPMAEARTLATGSTLTIITTLTPQQVSPFRGDMGAPPRDLRVVPGEVEEARHAYVHFASRRAATMGLVALALASAFAAVGLFNL